jgi:hypothetical protein
MKADVFEIAGRKIKLGHTVDAGIEIAESYSGAPVTLPLRVVRAPRPGPSVFVVAAIHGDELNGAGVIRELLERPFDLERGTLVLVPVVNLLGFERHSRYLPDRRDLNRCFPGSPKGSQASRLADKIFREIVLRCDYGIDLHTAALRRTNFPNVRADLSDPAVRRIAKVFGCELIVDSRGPRGNFRGSACRAGCPTIVLEAGEVWKIEPAVVEIGVRGIRNVLIELGMVAGKPKRPVYQTRVRRTTWVRAELGGILQFHVAPGDIVDEGQPLATNTSLLGIENRVLKSPVDGVILGMTTLPAVNPGDPVCHVAVPGRKVSRIREILAQAPGKSLHGRLREDLATNVTVSEREAPPGGAP